MNLSDLQLAIKYGKKYSFCMLDYTPINRTLPTCMAIVDFKYHAHLGFINMGQLYFAVIVDYDLESFIFTLPDLNPYNC